MLSGLQRRKERRRRRRRRRRKRSRRERKRRKASKTRVENSCGGKKRMDMGMKGRRQQNKREERWKHEEG